MRAKLCRDSEAFLAHSHVTSDYYVLSTGTPTDYRSTLTSVSEAASAQRFESPFIASDLGSLTPAIYRFPASRFSRAAKLLN